MLNSAALRPWEIASVAFFAYAVAATIALPRLPKRAGGQALAGAAGGFALTAASIVLPPTVLHGWVLPPALLLVAYWTSGRLFIAPLPLVAGMFLAAAAISAGAVGGRYHYAADAILGWVVAVVVWSLL